MNLCNDLSCDNISYDLPHHCFLILRLFELGFQNLLIRHQAKKLRYTNVYILNNPNYHGNAFMSILNQQSQAWA